VGAGANAAGHEATPEEAGIQMGGQPRDESTTQRYRCHSYLSEHNAQRSTGSGTSSSRRALTYSN
jgi:hypothetical protein